MIKYLWLILCLVSCSVVAPKKETMQMSQTHLYKLNFKNTASELKTILLSLGVRVEKATEEEGKGQIVTSWTSTRGVRYPLEQRLIIEYRYKSLDYTLIKVISDLQTQTPWEVRPQSNILDQIENKKKELSVLEEKRKKIEILELGYQKEKEKLERELKELEEEREKEVFDIKAEEDLASLFLSGLSKKIEKHDPKKTLRQKEILEKIFSLAEKIVEKRDDASSQPKGVLDKKELSYSIWKLAEENRQVIPRIIYALEDQDEKTRIRAAIALWATGNAPMTPVMVKDAQRLLKRTLKDSNPVVREYSQKALNRLMEE